MMTYFPASIRTLAGALALTVAAVVTPTAAAAEAPVPVSAESHLDRLEQRAREVLPAAGSGHARTGAAPSPAFAVGDCGEASAPDPDEGTVIDIGLSAAFADCNGELSAGVVTYDAWDDSDLESYIVRLDTDRNGSTGCSGFDWAVVVVESAGSFPGFVFRENSACQVGEPAAEAMGGRSTDRDFVVVFWDRASVGSPTSFAFTTATRSAYGTDFDFAPDPGLAQPVLTIQGGGTPPPPPPPPTTPPPGPRSMHPACAVPGGFEDGFGDVPPSNPHEVAIDCIVYWQVTTGSRPGIYVPTGGVSRGQMASFLARFIEQSGGTLPANPPNAFPDDNGSTHEASINKLAAAGIATGRTDGSFAPNGPVLRSQMATFIVRAIEYRLQLPVNDGQPAPNYFSDDGGDAHEPNINKAAAIGITGGTQGTNYSPQQPVRRDQMASFLARALSEVVELSETAIPAPPPKCPSDPTIERTDSSCRA